MPAFAPWRFTPPFHPVQQKACSERVIIALSRTIKGALFGCQMCGSCILPENAFLCPMTCPRGLRNGPCRGSSANQCFIEPAHPCIWFRIFQRAEQQGRLESLLEVNAPLDSGRLGCEPLLDDYHTWRRCQRRPKLCHLLTNRARFKADWESFRYRSRQPDWWQGDSQYHPPTYCEPASKYEAMLRAGQFPISAEVAPPMEPTGERVTEAARSLRDWVTTANFTDNPLGVPRMSGLACALHSLANDLEPVLQLQTRHRNRYDFEAEVFGATALGIRNILCLTDDIGRLGPGPRPRPELNDLDTVQALWMLRRLRDEGINIAGETVSHRPRYFLGAMASPLAALPRYEAVISEKKINAGAQFLQTLPIFELTRFDSWLEALDKRNLLDKVYLVPCVAYLKSSRHARFMANEVPGVAIPRSLMTRIENATDPGEEGIQIALELIMQLKRRPSIHGLHILAPHEEQVVPRLLKAMNFRQVTVEMAGSNGHPKINGRTNETQAHFGRRF